MPSGIAFSDEEKQERKEFMLAHKPEEFAEKFGIKLNSARVMYAQYGVRIKREKHYITKLPDIPKETFAAFAENNGISKVCAYFGIAPKTARKLYALYGVQPFMCRGEVLPCKHKLKRTGETQDMIRYLAKEYTYASIARVFGYSKERVRQICLMEVKE